MCKENIVWQNNKVSHEDRCQVMGQPGMVLWFTGLSGSGKSTIAVEVEKELHKLGKKVYLLDGDNIRTGINSDLGFTDADRDENIRRISEIAALFQDAGIITLVSFISPFAKMRAFARQRADKGHFAEIYIRAGFETCQKRDPKGLYKKQIANFTGKTSPYEVPEHPDLIVDTETCSVETCVKQVMDYILDKIDIIS